MGLASLDFGGLGQFDPKAKATFRINTLDLPTNWEYIYQNREMLLKVDQYGPVYAQADPPTDIMLLRRDPFQRCSSWLLWLRSDDFSTPAFTNFFRPAPGIADPSTPPDALEITFAPEAATYAIEHEGVRCATTLFVPTSQRAVCFSAEVTNLRSEPLRLSLIPALRPHANPAVLAPWDKPEWYLTTGLVRDGNHIGFATRMMNMNGEPWRRRTVAFWSEAEGATACEISHIHFIGSGSFENPQAVHEGRLRLSPETANAWADFGREPVISGFPPVYALQYDLELAPGESRTLRQSLAMLPPEADGAFPSLEAGRKVSVLATQSAQENELGSLRVQYETLAGARRIETPDAMLNDYANDWLPLQLDWACSLDRGWPSGMRGSRDSANDFTAMAPLNAEWSRQILETLYSCQRTDGWFPRQYSALGRAGKHDMREHVDAGCWVVELLYEYLCFSKDFDFLAQPLPWLDREEEASVLTHTLEAIDYFIRPGNIGEHGLCKIGEGDWLDSVNRAGLRGRGETVMVTGQTIIAMRQMLALLDVIEPRGLIDAPRATEMRALYERRCRELADALNAHAYNPAGYYSSVFNDDGRWLFSDRDPDGEKRVYGPALAFAIASGAAGPERSESALKQLDFLRCDDGYRLYWPPLGAKPIPTVGRGASGDQPAGLWENANPYNQGSHGFVGRALAVAGRGDLLYDAIRYLLPYDQACHPLASAKTPPYAVVNCWQGVPGFERHGGMQFLTGSIAYALRMLYDWMLGIRAEPASLAIDPCVPRRFAEIKARFPYLGREVELTILNPDGKESGVKAMTLNGAPVATTHPCPFSGRTLFAAGDDLFDREVNRIEARL